MGGGDGASRHVLARGVGVIIPLPWSATALRGNRGTGGRASAVEDVRERMGIGSFVVHGREREKKLRLPRVLDGVSWWRWRERGRGDLELNGPF